MSSSENLAVPLAPLATEAPASASLIEAIPSELTRELKSPANSIDHCSIAPSWTDGVSLHLRLPCDLSAVRAASLKARQFLDSRGLEEELLAACELALVEACNNAVLYAQEQGRSQLVEVQVSSHPGHLELHIIDHTPGFDWPVTLELPGAKEERGRGLYLIQSLMDSVSYLRGRGENRLILRKRRPVATPSVNSQPPHNFGRSSESAQSPSWNEFQQKLALSERALNTMAEELCLQIAQARQQQESLDSRLLAHELDIARNIQQSLLPKSFPALPGFGLSGFCTSARQVGGDFYDVLPLGQDSVLLVVADVMGKGVPAALFAATLRTHIRTNAEWTQRPSELLARINRLMFEELSLVDMFITALVAVANTRQRSLVIASAGHCPVLLTSANGDSIAVSPEGIPLGILPNAKFCNETISLEPYRLALLYTDGVTEARNHQGQLFGQQRLLNWLRQNVHRKLTAPQLTENFLSELNGFQSSASLKDDQTLLILAAE